MGGTKESAHNTLIPPSARTGLGGTKETNWGRGYRGGVELAGEGLGDEQVFQGSRRAHDLEHQKAKPPGLSTLKQKVSCRTGITFHFQGLSSSMDECCLPTQTCGPVVSGFGTL